jgi:FlaG/FlaF family flagellin (archaellin)
MFDKKNSSGVSPVIGIILTVTVTVGLVALASTIVFDLGSNVNEPADVSASLEFDNETDEVIAKLVRNENAQRVFLRFNKGDFGITGTALTKDGVGTGNSEVNIADDSGATGTEVLSADSDETGTVELVAVVGDTGNEQVITTVKYDSSSTTTKFPTFPAAPINPT